jgi:hypothetical protein
MRRLTDFTTAALEASNLGLAVFPLRPGDKRPAIKAWQGRATTEPRQIIALGAQFQDANVGAAARDTLVIDVDGPQGERNLRALGLELPETLMVRTKRGQHFIYRAKLPNGCRRELAPKVDIKGNVRGRATGYTVVPTSYVAGHTYAWDGAEEIAAAPPELIEAVTPERRETRTHSGAVIPEGSRNLCLVRYAGQLVRAGTPPEAIQPALAAYNRTYCRPPLDDDELRKISRQAQAWPAVPEWVLDPLGFAQDERLSRVAQHLLCVLGLADKLGTGRMRGGQWLRRALGDINKNTLRRAETEAERHGRLKVIPPEKRGPGHAKSYLLLPRGEPWGIRSSQEGALRTPYRPEGLSEARSSSSESSSSSSKAATPANPITKGEPDAHRPDAVTPNCGGRND